MSFLFNILSNINKGSLQKSVCEQQAVDAQRMVDHIIENFRR